MRTAATRQGRCRVDRLHEFDSLAFGRQGSPATTLNESSPMWIPPESAFRASLHFTDLFGSLLLAQVDAAQRLHFLAGRLFLGATSSRLRSHALRQDDVLYAVDRAELDSRLNRMLEAGAEGCVTILKGLIDETGAAQMRWVRSVCAVSEAEHPVLRLVFSGPDPVTLALRRDVRARLSAGG